MSVESSIGRNWAVFAQLRESRLVRYCHSLESGDLNSDIPAQHIEEFKNLLNMAKCVTEKESTVGETIRYLYRSSKGAFMRYLWTNNIPHLILYFDGFSIAKALKIDHIIDIKWSKENEAFEVAKHTEETLAHSRAINTPPWEHKPNPHGEFPKERRSKDKYDPEERKERRSKDKYDPKERKKKTENDPRDRKKKERKPTTYYNNLNSVPRPDIVAGDQPPRLWGDVVDEDKSADAKPDETPTN